MTISRQLLFAMLTWGLAALPVHQSRAQERETLLVQGMKKLGEDWRLLSQTEDVLIIRCPNNTFTGVRLLSGAVVSVDLQRTNSVIDPYLGIVRIAGRFQFNNSPKDGSCSKTLLEAKQNTRWHDNDRDFDYEIYYKINGTELWLADGNTVFRNNFMSQPGEPRVNPNSAWLKAFRFPLM